MPWNSELCVAFYVGHPAVPGPEGRLLAQLDLIGVTNVQVERMTIESRHGDRLAGHEVTGRWAELDVEVWDWALDVYRAITLVFPGAAIPALGRDVFWRRVTEAFRSACERLRPAAAFVADLPGPGVDAMVADREQWLVDANPVPLFHDGFALLHLSEARFPDLEGLVRGLPHRRIPLAGGLLLVGVEAGG